LLVAAGLALATAAVGVMAAFGLVFFPAMIAYRWGRTWRHAVGIATVVGVAAYTSAFAIALVHDQPFGPVLVLSMVAAAAVSWAVTALLRR
jgi:zinc transport system permease protein